MIRRVAVYCGSKEGNSPRFKEAASALGAAMASRKLDLVYGGAANGLMGAVASAVLDGGGHVLGVIPTGLERQEWAHPELSEAIRVDTMHERKALMAERADAFIALPGGFGTMDELFDVLTQAQVGLHRKPIGLLNLDGYYAPLLEWVQRAFEAGFIPRVLETVLVSRGDPAVLVDALLAHQPPPSAVEWSRPRR